MADTVVFELVTPEKIQISEAVEMVVMPGAEGDFGVLPGHAPLISTIRPGVVSTYRGDKIEKQIFVAGGFAEVTETTATLLAEMAIPIEELSAEMAQKAIHDANAKISAAEGEVARNHAEADLAKAQAMMDSVNQ